MPTHNRSPQLSEDDTSVNWLHDGVKRTPIAYRDGTFAIGYGGKTGDFQSGTIIDVKAERDHIFSDGQHDSTFRLRCEWGDKRGMHQRDYYLSTNFEYCSVVVIDLDSKSLHGNYQFRRITRPPSHVTLGESLEFPDLVTLPGEPKSTKTPPVTSVIISANRIYYDPATQLNGKAIVVSNDRIPTILPECSEPAANMPVENPLVNAYPQFNIGKETLIAQGFIRALHLVSQQLPPPDAY